MHRTQPQAAGKTRVNHYLKVTSWPDRSVANAILAFTLSGFFWLHHGAAGNERRHTKTWTQASADAPQTNVNVDSNGVILRGYDPVAYFTRHQAVKGNPSVQTRFRGAIYHFASVADKAVFDKNPWRYVPQYGGFCAYHLSKGELTDSDPTAFFVYRGKLYVCSAADTAKEFRSNIDENVRNADENWVNHFGWHGNPPLR